MRILVGMSGGVDSTYAANKLIEEGHDVAGAILVMHDYTEVSAAEASAAALGIPLYNINCRKQFEEAVVSNFIDEYRHGRTPNPCIVCNSRVKFDCLLDFAKYFQATIFLSRFCGLCRDDYFRSLRERLKGTAMNSTNELSHSCRKK